MEKIILKIKLIFIKPLVDNNADARNSCSLLIKHTNADLHEFSKRLTVCWVQESPFEMCGDPMLQKTAIVEEMILDSHRLQLSR